MSSHIPVAQAVAPPNAPPPLTHQASTGDITPEQERDMIIYLKEMKFPEGLARTMVEAHRMYPLRIWIVDNSGSMSINDGKRTIQGRSVRCSRWEELSETIDFHANFSAATRSHTSFRLLNNHPYEYAVGTPRPGTQEFAAQLEKVKQAMRTGPAGGTPLCQQVLSAAHEIRTMLPQLQAVGQRCVLVIATDGQPTDGRLDMALKELERLPVLVIIRMCTDEDDIVEFYNNIDANLELSMDVLDDLRGEALEVNSVNSWLVYGEPLHKAREFGIHHKLFDLIDETRFSPGQIKEFCEFLLGNGSELLTLRLTTMPSRLRSKLRSRAPSSFEILSMVRTNRGLIYPSYGKLAARAGAV